ncbi:Retrovirus-related Pol polyprotein from transposon 297 [Vitis vinifera]|uniref:Retrovirus-related Pol polyprotein from transposon 297 n=1 Tax=Vitis vinifera TaxID=29760 RepID=A0A438FEY1_VITVI|nr:Retrovirus-related Pol polyprotein from transposon 297 [Vitis vinifera]
MQSTLRQNYDVFAWAHSDMKGIDPSITSHKLNILPTARPIRQKWWYPKKKENDGCASITPISIMHVQKTTSFATNRSNCGFYCWARDALFLGCLLRISPDPHVPADEEKTAFITPHNLYCYRVMPFGLKNAGATYQRLMTKIFKPLLGHTVELNPFKCAFGVSAGKFLGFMVSQRGIEVSPDQVKAVIETPPPRNKKELQRLTGKLVALGRFIARFTDELRPFFLAIRKAGTNGWTDNCQNAFEKIKHCLMQPPILSSPLPKEKLYMYLVVSEWAISAVLFRYPSPKEQKTYLLRQQSVGGRRNQVFKSGANSFSPSERCPKAPPLFPSPPGGSGVGLLLQSPTGEHLEQAIRLGFPASNNEAEYEAILFGLDLALALSVSKLRVYSDLQLIVRYVQKEYEAKDARMTRYLTKVRDTLQRFTEWTIEKIRRTENGRADALADIAASLPIKEAILLPIHVQTYPSVTETSTCNTIETSQADD